ncbi:MULTISPECIES: VTT domain-containing protein [unclassified Arthrobacter]|uniref:DedA family protein n=1 Tax=unclassified Arthrobacter TaxID=235627 RepID=UPI00339486DC
MPRSPLPSAGDQTGYLIGRKAGPAVFNKPGSRLMRREYVDKAHGFFEKYGRRSVVLARFVPTVRTFLPVTAGVATMTYRSFIAFNAIGANSVIPAASAASTAAAASSTWPAPWGSSDQLPPRPMHP